MVFAIIRIRGSINMKPDIHKTLRLFRLTRVNHCALVEENPVSKGMLQLVKDYATWGELSAETLEKMIESRGKLVGDKPLSAEYLKSSTSFKTVTDLANAIAENKFLYRDLPDIKPLFRLSPPKKGYEGIKRSYENGGALGYRGKDINTLIERML